MRRSEIVRLVRRTVSRASSDRCPDVDAWARLRDRQSDEGERLRLARHLARCPPCAELWEYLVVVGDSRLADRIGGASTTAAPSREGAGDGRVEDSAGRELEPGRSGRRGGAGRSARLAVAALAVLGIALALASLSAPIRDRGDLRSRGGRPTLAASSTTTAAETVLEWRRWPGASSYRVRVWSPDGTTIVDRRVPAGRLRVPVVLPDADEPHRWRVEALRSGRVVASSRLHSLPP